VNKYDSLSFRCNLTTISFFFEEFALLGGQVCLIQVGLLQKLIVFEPINLDAIVLK
jgi:hypothetical protein